MNTLVRLITPVDIPHFLPKIKYNDTLSMAGSCFSEHMEQKLKRYKYNVLSNPFGILFNPSAIATSFNRIADRKYYLADELVMHDGLYHSMDHHGSFSGEDKTDVLEKINAAIDQAHAHYKKCNYFFVSLGTSRVYRYKPSGKIAGNNHKLPSTNFTEEIMSIEDCYTQLNSIHRDTKNLSPDSKIIWTVSPVRHVKDGLTENARSKARLLLAIERIIREQKDSNYFPAYEIMIDQLRDYRFYAKDMIHPSEVAIDIIWQLWSEKYFDAYETEHHGMIEKIMKAREHRVMHQNKSALRAFAEGQLRSIDHLYSLFPDMDLKEEKQYFFHMIEPD